MPKNKNASMLAKSQERIRKELAALRLTAFPHEFHSVSTREDELIEARLVRAKRELMFALDEVREHLDSKRR